MRPLDAHQVRQFQHRLIGWYVDNGRDLPWRRTRDPYHILVSEIMLQQTQVERVLGYYDGFLRRYPTIEALAASSEPQVRESWEGLGYYARARNLLRTARQVTREFGGRIPSDPEQIRTLPGIGRYTAGAILSFAYDQDAAILDTNAARVLARVFGIRTRNSKLRLQRRLWEVAEAVTPRGNAPTFNQAIMDLGAMLCRPRRPECGTCPVRRYCRSAARAVQRTTDGAALQRR